MDPLVQLTGQAYSYAGDNPINFNDPLGLCGCSTVATILGTIDPFSHCNYFYQSGLHHGAAGRWVQNNDLFYHSLQVWFGGVNPIAPLPPGYNPRTWTKGPSSRPSNPYDSYYDPNGTEWRYHPEDNWHNPHWDTKAPGKGTPWEQEPIGELPPVKIPIEMPPFE